MKEKPLYEGLFASKALLSIGERKSFLFSLRPQAALNYVIQPKYITIGELGSFYINVGASFVGQRLNAPLNFFALFRLRSDTWSPWDR